MPAGMPGLRILLIQRGKCAGPQRCLHLIARAAQCLAKLRIGQRPPVHRFEAPPQAALDGRVFRRDQGAVRHRGEIQRLKEAKTGRRSCRHCQLRRRLQARHEAAGGLRRPPEAAGVHAHLAVAVP